MKLVIVESPSKSKTIQKYLGADYKVMASGGHICDLPAKVLGVDTENNYKPQYEVPKEKKELLKNLKQAVKQAEKVFLATDPDREGEAISWHLATQLGLKDTDNRIVFNEISSKAVNAALGNPRELNMQLVDAQQARRVLDRLVGYKVSPILNKKIKSGLSGGRVQSAALKMVVDREREIRDFKPEEYWNMFAFLRKQNDRKMFRAAFNDLNGKKLKVKTKEQNDSIVTALNDAKYIVDSVKRGVSKSRPSAPFTTSTLQQDGSHKLNLTSPQVMQIAQQLYEGLDIPGEGHTALVTYIRTDSTRVSPDMQTETLKFISEKYGKDFSPKTPNIYKSKSDGVQDAHEAIRPISLEINPELLRDKIPKNHYRLYKLIYDRFIASQMSDAIFNTLTVHITATSKTASNDKYGFKVGGKTLVFAGYTAVYNNASENEEESDDNLPNLEEKDVLSLKELTSEQKFTKPPARFSDATMVKAMEENGIGRPSTYASVISILSKREYTIKELKFIVPTELGERVTEFMEKYFKDIVNVTFTAGMEAKLDEIEKGVMWQDIIAKFFPPFMETIQIAARDGQKVQLTEEVSDVICDKCGANMVVRSGKFGKFLACPKYPTCKNIKNIVENVGKCPACGGDISKRRTKTGKIFYGCSNYPNCNFMSWEVPAPFFCEKCGKAMRIITKNDSTQYVCINRACNHSVSVKKEDSEHNENENG